MKKNNGSAIIHRNTLVPSRPDDITLNDAVTERFKIVLDDYLRIRHVPLVPPNELSASLVLWRTLAQRHKKGDFRHTLDELRAMQRVAQWTVDVKKSLANQATIDLEWDH